ncbi:hypothetical protein CVV65_13565 [Kyrpidia spormannii]|uniref:Uncharacterized protein n=1 Tax=Kyrpidia spormannii TaxID=2055160 RepID=A0A2K8NAI7_9BACL|nr:hypothetical protein [Kyrpidia spormannii]ATY85827.1 hypothetical protein CVV65_13565 [Kyrpidia spormannii]
MVKGKTRRKTVKAVLKSPILPEYSRKLLTESRPTNVFGFEGNRRLFMRWANLGIIESPIRHIRHGRKGVDAIESAETAARLSILADYYQWRADDTPPYLSKALGDGAYAVILALHGGFPLTDAGWELMMQTIVSMLEKRYEKMKHDMEYPPLIANDPGETRDMDELVQYVAEHRTQGKTAKKMQEQLNEFPIETIWEKDFDRFTGEYLTGNFEQIAALTGETTEKIKQDVKKEGLTVFQKIAKLETPDELIRFLGKLPLREWKLYMEDIVTNSILSLWLGHPLAKQTAGVIFQTFNEDITEFENYVWTLFVMDSTRRALNRTDRRAYEKGRKRMGFTREKVWETYRRMALERIQFPEPETGE